MPCHCCYKAKSVCSKIVAAISVLIIGAGFGVIAVGIMQSSNKSAETDYSEFKIDHSTYGILALVIGLSAVLTGFLGIVAACKGNVEDRNLIFTIPFGTLTLLAGVFMFVSGVLMMGL